MPIKFTNSKAKGLTISWATEDGSRTARFTISTTAPEQEQLKELAKALGFLMAQNGMLPSAPATDLPSTAPEQSAPPVVQQAASAPLDQPAGKILMMPATSLPDAPAGGAPANSTFWESMPTTTVPTSLQQAWEIIPPGEA